MYFNNKKLDKYKKYMVKILLIISSFWIISCTKPSNMINQGEVEEFLSGILVKIKDKEQSVDASCWTSTRHIEEFAAHKKMDEKAQILKIKVLKILLYKVWIQSSQSKC